MTSGGKRKLIRGVHPSDQQCGTTPRSRWRGWGAFRYPVPQNSMMTRGDLRTNINNHRYGGPVQTPSRGRECSTTNVLKWSND